MLSEKFDRHLSLELPERDCLIHYQVFLHLFCLECAMIVHWSLPGLSFLLIGFVLVHYQQYLSGWAKPPSALIYRPSEAWVIVDFSGNEFPVELQSMRWNASRWVILNLRHRKGQRGVISIILCPGNLNAQSFEHLKRIYLLGGDIKVMNPDWLNR